MRNKPFGYKHADPRFLNFGRTADSRLLAKRRYAEGGEVDDDDTSSDSQSGDMSDLVEAMKAQQDDPPVKSEHSPQDIDMRQAAPPDVLMGKGVELPPVGDPGTMPSRNISRRGDIGGGHIGGGQHTMSDILNEAKMAQDLEAKDIREYGGKKRNEVLHPSHRDLSKEIGYEDIDRKSK